MCHLLSSALEFMEAKKPCHQVVQTSLLISYSEELCIVSSRLPRPWSSEARLVTLMGLDNQNAIKRVPDRLQKERLWRLGYPADMLHFYWPTDVHNQLRLPILRELCTIIERNAYINWYFRCSIVCLKLCKEYLNMATFEISVLLLIKSRTFRYTDRIPMSSYTGVIHF